MKQEAVNIMEPQDGKIYVDCTLGGGGHSGLILEKIQPNGRLISFDIDDDAIAAASDRLKNFNNITIVKSSYTNLRKVLKELNIERITGGLLLDLGASYHQLTKAERGFSFSKEAPLDMRFDQDASITAYDIVNSYKEEDLVRIFSEYGEERFSKRIAKKNCRSQKKSSYKNNNRTCKPNYKRNPKSENSFTSCHKSISSNKNRSKSRTKKRRNNS